MIISIGRDLEVVDHRGFASAVDVLEMHWTCQKRCYKWRFLGLIQNDIATRVFLVLMF